MKTFGFIPNMRPRISEPEDLRSFLLFSWRVLLGCSLIIMLSIFIYGGWQLYVVMSDVSAVQTNTASGTSQNVPINSMQVDAVLQGFSARQARFDANKASSTVIIDPAQ